MTLLKDQWETVRPDPWAQFPPRSRLVRLAPMGIGTAFRESLGSYYMRLADAHSLQPTTMAWDLAFPERGKLYQGFEDAWKRPYFNGIGDPTQEWVTRLEALTLAEGLGSLTMGFLRGRVSTRGLVCAKARWCPACFKEDAQQGIPYARLLWTFAAVTCCPRHLTRLVERCGCGADGTRATGMAKCLPYICVRCSCDLGSMVDLDQGMATSKEIRHAKLVADLLVSELALGGRPPDRDIANFLDESITRHAEGKAAGLARLLGVGKSTFHGWIHRGHFPDFSQIITIAEAHGCSIDDVLCGRSQAVTRNPMVLLSERKVASSGTTRCPRRLDWDAITERLNEFLQADKPITLIEAGRRLGIAPETLRHNKPELCVAIASRWREWHIATARVRGMELEEQVRGIAHGLVEKGVRPTWRAVLREGFPTTPLWRGSRRLHAICKEVQVESAPK